MYEAKEIENAVGDEYSQRRCAEAIHPPLDQKELARVYRKIDLHMLPVMALIYTLCYLDRSNIGNAKVMNIDTGDDLMHTLNMTEFQYRIAMMLFLVAYSLFEVPSNLAMKALSPPVWLGCITVAFGSFCASIGGSSNVPTIMALRFLLGAAEAGVFPGILFYLGFWYGARERGVRIAVFICGITLSGAFGGAIAYGVRYMNGIRGLPAWRWLFILEGVPCIALAVIIMLFLPGYPEKAKWLTTREKALLRASLGDNAPKGDDKLNWDDATATLKEVRLWVHYILYFCLAISASSLSLFAPTIVKGIGYRGIHAQLFVIPPYACAFVVTIAMAYISDRYRCRGLVVAACFASGTITFLIQACVSTPSLHLRYAMLVLSTCATFACLPSLCAWVPDNVHTTTAASLANAISVAFSGPGQIIGVWTYKGEQAPRYQLGHAVNAGGLFLGLVLSLGLWWFYRRQNATIPRSSRKWVP